MGFLDRSQQAKEALDLHIDGPLLFEWDGLTEEALQDTDKRLRQRWNDYGDRSQEIVTTSHYGKSNEDGPLIYLPHTIRLDPMLRSLIRENGGGKGR